MKAPKTSPEQQLQWLHALLDWDRADRWLQPHCPDDQFRALALAYAMKELRADAIRDFSTTGHWESPEPGHPLRSFWVYGFEVSTPNPEFVGIYGEASRREAEMAAAARCAGRVVHVPLPGKRWEDAKPHAYESLDRARPFYSRETFNQLQHLSALAASYIRARELAAQTHSAPAQPAPTPRL